MQQPYGMNIFNAKPTRVLIRFEPWRKGCYCMVKKKSIRKFVSLFCVFAMLCTIGVNVMAAPGDPGDPGDPSPKPGVATLVWTMADHIATMPDGAPVSTGVINPGGGAGLTVSKNTIVQEVNGWDFLARTVDAITVTRNAAADSLRLDPAAMSMESGEVYIWEIEGYRTGATSVTHRAAFGTVNSANATTNSAAAASFSNTHAYRPGYFFLKATITHTNDISAYSFYGVASGNTTAAAGGFVITGITLKKANPYILYETDFSDGTPGIVEDASNGGFFGVVEDTTAPGNYVLRSDIQAGSGNYYGYSIPNTSLNAPSGATFRATVVARRAAGTSSLNARLRVATNTGGSVSWEAMTNDAALAASPAWTTYNTGSRELVASTSIEAIQFIRQSTSWVGMMEMDSFKLEIIEAPAEEIDGLWENDIPSLKDAFADYFTVGNVLDRIPGASAEEMFLRQYSSLTLENGMKPGGMSSSQGVYTFDSADIMAQWAEDNGIQFIGHTLLWHSQSAAWLTTDVDYFGARANLNEFIDNVAGHFSGKVYSWDVVNEVMTDPSSSTNAWYTYVRAASGHPWRAAYSINTPAGANNYDFIYDAFMFARLADPYAILQYNDYNDDNINKARNIVNMVNDLNLKWARDEENNYQGDAAYSSVQQYLDDGGRVLLESVGLQSHYSSSTSISNIRNAFALYATMAGVKLSITELDITTGGDTTYNPVPQRALFNEIFKLYMANAHLVDRVTFWGLNDSTSWRSTNNPTMFAKPTVYDPYFRAKPALHDVTDLLDNYSPPGLSAAFDNGSRAASIKQNEADGTQITLTLQGGLAFTAPDLASGDYNVRGLPSGTSVASADIVDATTAVLILSGAPDSVGVYDDIRISVNKSVVSGANLGDIAGNVVGTRWVQPLALNVEAPPSIVISGPDSVVSGAGATATYTIAARDMVPLGGIDFSITVDGDYLSSKDFTFGSGFQLASNGNYGTPLYWTNTGNIWTGRAILLNADAPSGDFDIITMTFNAAEGVLGATDVKLNYIITSYAGAPVNAIIANDTVSTVFEQWYSPYDLNKDGVIDLNDLTFALQFLLVVEGDPEWELAKVCDFEPDGKIGIEDLIMILANYTIPYYS